MSAYLDWKEYRVNFEDPDYTIVSKKIGVLFGISAAIVGSLNNYVIIITIVLFKN